MPSLFTHLLVAEKALEALRGREAGVLLGSHSRFFYLGSLAPDFPYYGSLVDYRGLRLGGRLCAIGHEMEATLARWAGRRSPVVKGGWEDRFHGFQSASMVRGWLAQVAAEEDLYGRPTAVRALLAGMLCHIQADEVFHPVIDAETGDPDSLESQYQHRSLEISMDYAFLERHGIPVETVGLKALLERYFGHSPAREAWFPEWLGREWRRLAWPDGSGDGEPLQKWLEGFWRAQAFLEHPLSPMVLGREAYLRARGISGSWPPRLQGLLDCYDRAVTICPEKLEQALYPPFAGESRGPYDQASCRL